MMRLAILNPLIPRTPEVGREMNEKKKQFSESNFFFEKIIFFKRRAKLLHAQNMRENGKSRWKPRNHINVEEYHEQSSIMFK